MRETVESRSLIVSVPPMVLLLASRLLRPFLADVVLTRDEIAGLRAGLLVSRGPPTGSTRFTDWLSRHAGELGREWASELARHYR